MLRNAGVGTQKEYSKKDELALPLAFFKSFVVITLIVKQCDSLPINIVDTRLSRAVRSIHSTELRKKR